MKTKLCVILLSILPLLSGQDKPATQEKTVTKLVMLQNEFVDAHLLDGIGLNIKHDGKALVITGPEETVNAALVILKQLDVPPPPPAPAPPAKNIELTAQMIVASPGEAQAKPLPAELDPVVKQLRAGFPYRSYGLLETAFLRMRDQGQHASTEGALSNPDYAPSGSYEFGVNQTFWVATEERVHLRGINLALHVPIKNQNGNVTMGTVRVQTDVDIKPGQQVVIGKANLDQNGDALIVVLTAKVVD
jgi:hypothetical protein